MATKIYIDTDHLPESSGIFFSDLLKRRIAGRVEAVFSGQPESDLQIHLSIDPHLSEESFRIADGDAHAVHIDGGGRRGLLYGIGKFLRTAEYEPAGGEGFQPGLWRGISTPAKPVRGMYFATHFRNFYHRAPLPEIEQYLEDLALWGYNALTVWFDMHHYRSIQDEEAQAMLSRLRAILAAAHKLGLQIGLLVLGNEAYDYSPVELRAEWKGGQNGYFRDLPMYHVELCPNKQEGFDLLLRWRREVFEAFADLPFSYIWVWPYDQGGCGCADCAPWGGNGFLKIAKPITHMAQEFFPSAKIILSTWYFDCYTHGEFEAFDHKIQQDHGWIDYVMAEHPGRYPRYILENGVPGELPLLGFPEISMFESTPWGGFGANPLPGYLSNMWQEVGQIQAGGFPYSEGIFEDLNKAIVASCYWTGKVEVEAAVEEYANQYFSGRVKAQVVEAVRLLESTNCRKRLWDGKPEWAPEPAQAAGDEQFVIAHPEGIERAASLLAEIDRGLPPAQRQSWRWRILFLRGLIDQSLARNDFRISETCEAAFSELIQIYHAEDAIWAVRPPSRRNRNVGWN